MCMMWLKHRKESHQISSDIDQFSKLSCNYSVLSSKFAIKWVVEDSNTQHQQSSATVCECGVAFQVWYTGTIHTIRYVDL